MRCTLGEVIDVAVDICRSSPTFGQWVGVNLSADNKRQLWIPEGFAHGFLALSEYAEFIYKTTSYYYPQSERAIKYDDLYLNIGWGGCVVEISEKDRKAVSLLDADLFS